MNENIKPIGRLPITIGAIPTSYLISLTYEEQLLYLCRKMDEVINFINEDISQEIKNYIDQEFDNIIINAMYDSTNEKLILYKEVVNNG